jgi:diguanylate cyclase (GGDEF)-like protein/PAS domain S-box-containing protein
VAVLASAGLTGSYPKIAIVWPVAGIALAALLVWGLAFAPAVFIGSFAGLLFLGKPVGAAFGLALADATGPLAGAWLLGRVLRISPTLATIRDVFLLIFGGALAPGLVSASVAVTALAAADALGGVQMDKAWLAFWASDVQGILFVAPALLAWSANARPERSVGEVVGIGCAIALGLLSMAMMLSDELGPGPTRYVLSLALFPLALWPAVHYPMREVATLNLVVALLCIAGTAAGLGPFAAAPGVVAMQALLSLVAVTTLVLAARSAEGRDASRRLAESEARFRSLTELSVDWYWEQDAELRFTRLSPGFTASTGIAESEYLGKRRWELPYVDPQATDLVEHRRCVEAREPFRDFLMVSGAADGKRRYSLASGEPVFGPEGAFLGYRGVSRDITAQKRSEAALEASRGWFARLFDDGPTPMMLRGFHDGIVSAVNDEWCRFYGRAREETVGRDVRSLRLTADPADSERIQASVEASPTVRDLEIAVLGAGGDVREVQFSAQVVDLEGAPAVISTIADVTERNRAQREVVASRRRFEKLFRASPQPVAISGLEHGEVIDVSDAWIRAYGYERDEVLGRNFVDLGLWVDLGQRIAIRDRLHADGRVDGWECTWRRRNGEIADVLFFADLVSLGGDRVMLSTGMDITERKRQERMLVESERRFATIFRSSPVPVLISRLADGAYVEVNEAWTQLFGYQRVEALGRSSLELGIWVNPAEREMLAGMLAAGEPVRNIEVHMRKKSGELCDVLVSAERLELAGQDCVLSSLMDISEQKRSERALRESERRFRDFAEAAGEYVWEVDARGQFVFLSKRVHAALGYAPEEMYGRAPYSFMPPGEDARMRDWARNTLATRQTFRNVEYRMLSRSGSQVWQSASGVPIIDAAGRLTGYRGTAVDVTERKRAEARIADLATRDPLTGLPNRLLLGDRLAQALVSGEREGTLLAVLFIDLDHFKGINDSLGHEMGDVLLKEVANRIAAVLRKGDTLSRLGGDEFVVLLEGLKTPEDAGQVAQKIIAGLAHEVDLAGNIVRTSGSVGIAVYPADGTDASTLMRHADTAMYVAKSGGRGIYQFYSSEMTSRASERVQLEAGLKRALEEGELRVLYQPRVEVDSGHLTGVEALLRWQHPERGLLAASQFMRLANESGLIHAIGEWALNAACGQAAALHAVYGAAFAISVNISTKQFSQGLVGRVKKALDESGLDAQLLELELAEAALVRDPAAAKTVIARLRRLGVRIVIDDFGTGYSSLGDLRRYGIDGIKIDRSLIRGITTNPDDRVVVQATIDMARSLRIVTVAEGVEDAETLALLKEMGCEEYLGYFRAEPMVAGDFERRFLRVPNIVTFPRRG